MPVDVWEGTKIVCCGFRPWCCDTDSSSHFTKLVTSSDPHGPSVTHTLVTDPCLSLSALLTPTRAPHARLLKHWKGRIASLLALVRQPHAHHTLACSLARFLACMLPLWLASSLACFNSLFLFGSRALSLSSPPQNGPPILFISVARLGGRRVPPSSPRPTCAPLP